MLGKNVEVGVAGVVVVGHIVGFCTTNGGDRILRIECRPSFADLPSLARVADVFVLENGAEIHVRLSDIDFVDRPKRTKRC